MQVLKIPTILICFLLASPATLAADNVYIYGNGITVCNADNRSECHMYGVPFPSDTSSEPSFDCNRAKKAAEKAICNSSELGQMDSQMALLYYRYVSGLSANQKDSFWNNKQLPWLRQRNTCGSNVQCLVLKYQLRIDQLRALLKM